MDTLFFDVETSRFPDGNPFRSSSELISFAYGTRSNQLFGYYTDPDFRQSLQHLFSERWILVGINLKFDISWLRRADIELAEGTRVWDCQLAEFILSGQENSFASMDQLCERYGIEQKESLVKEYWDNGVETANIPRATLEEYNLGDIRRTQQIYEAQLADPRLTPQLRKLILIGGADLLVLQTMEQNGILYDSERSITLGNEAKAELDVITVELSSGLPPLLDTFNFDSGDDLSVFLYGGVLEREVWTEEESVYKSGVKQGQAYTRRRMGPPTTYSFPGIFKALPKTEVKRSKPERPLFSVAEPILRQLKGGGKSGKRIIELLLKRAELGKLVETYYFKIPSLIDGMEWDGFVHGQYNQVVARTGRLSSSKPNMQNNPESIDRLFITRYDNV